MPFEAALRETEERPAYQRIADEAEWLRRLRLSNSRIARRLGVDDKAVVIAIRWRNQDIQELQ